jgi:hypothetical protein
MRSFGWISAGVIALEFVSMGSLNELRLDSLMYTQPHIEEFIMRRRINFTINIAATISQSRLKFC